MALTFPEFRCLSDNHGYLIRGEMSGQAAAIDKPDAVANAAELGRLGCGLDPILNAHRHRDHVHDDVELFCVVCAAKGGFSRASPVSPISLARR